MVVHNAVRTDCESMKNIANITAGLAIILARRWRAVGQVAEESLREAGMCLTDFVALEALLHKGPLTITEIQDKVGLASGSMTAAVDLRKSFIRRKPSGNDRKAKLLELTPKGRLTVKRVFEHHAAMLESAMKVADRTRGRGGVGHLRCGKNTIAAISSIPRRKLFSVRRRPPRNVSEIRCHWTMTVESDLKKRRRSSVRPEGQTLLCGVSHTSTAPADIGCTVR